MEPLAESAKYFFIKPILTILLLVLIACGSDPSLATSTRTEMDKTGNSETQHAEKEIVKSNSDTPLLVTISVFAGNGSGVFSGDGDKAVNASMMAPSGLAIDSENNLYISTDNRIRKDNAETGIITTIAGTGRPGFSGDNGLANKALLKSPEGLAIDSTGNIYVADSDNGRVRRIDGETGTITTLAGGGIPKRVNGVISPGDGEAATEAFFKNPRDVAVDVDGSIYFTASNRIRKVDTNGAISTLAGSGLDELSGDGGPSTNAGISDPRGITIDTIGNIYFTDTYNQRIRKIDATTGIISTIAGIGHHPPQFHPESPIKPGGQGFSGDGGPATNAMLFSPNDLVINPNGDLYVADTGNNKIRKVNLQTGVITTFADGGVVRGDRMETKGGGGDLKITFKHFAPPVAIATTNEGVFFIADKQNNRVLVLRP